ncbi:response regulator with CheY-like receiver domain and winged-helix DNA-binding domain [Leptolyngbyaceae cyanobacterium JSC-12]|nr:response regulator with CheY-like receiver domain and winged-helix DNA-binding domain [Leptolyngbyaceae cyanobacterium JSC-12]
MRILLVDDDELLAQTLAHNLTSQHYAVDLTTDGEMGWDYAQAANYDLIVLDVNLPKLDGIRLCQRLRQTGYRKPILLLTAKGASSDKVLGLDAGADDYVVKPCTVEELGARVRALLRRQQPTGSPILEWGALRLNPSTCEVMYGAQEISLSAKEYSLLEMFLRQPQRIFSSSLILEHLWGFEDAPSEETVRTHIKRLRRKLKLAGAEDLIETVYGMGYRLNPLTPQAPSVERARSAAIALWNQFKAPCLERMAVLEQAVLELETGSLSEALRKQAEYAGHKLSGSLGMFGFPEGSRLSRKIEHWFQASYATADLPKLKTLMAKLCEELQQAPRSSEDTDWQTSLEEAIAAQKMPATSSPEAQATSVVLPSPSQSEITVLAVDDDPAVLDSLHQFLPRWGIRLQTLDDPRQLGATLATTTPDVLLLDVEMPHMDGVHLCQQIRGDRAWIGLPILFLSARTDTQTVQRLFSAGADDYIAKPFAESEIVIRIFNRLQRNHLLRSLGANDKYLQCHEME